MTSLGRKHQDWILLAIVNLTVPVVLIWKHHTGDLSRTVALLSAILSLVLLNVILVTAIHFRNRRNRRTISGNFVIGAVALGLVSVLLSAIGLYATAERNEYAELAFSNIPLDQIHPEQKALVVDLLRQMAADSRENAQMAAQIKPITPSVYSPESFANANVIRSVSDEYRSAAEEDAARHEKQIRIMTDFRTRMATVDPDYLKSFEAAGQYRNSLEAKNYELEREALAATLGLYEYAATHLKDITLKDGELRFADSEVETQFSRQLALCKALNKRWQEIRQEYLILRDQARQR
jgi:hypothetical protein